MHREVMSFNSRISVLLNKSIFANYIFYMTYDTVTKVYSWGFLHYEDFQKFIPSATPKTWRSGDKTWIYSNMGTVDSYTKFVEKFNELEKELLDKESTFCPGRLRKNRV